jgi:hypothetical protein
MAHTVDLSPAALASIARQIGERRSPSSLFAMAPGAALQVAESFPIWMLGYDALQQPAGRLATLAKDTGTLHHQINSGNQAREFARSVPATAPGGAADLQLVELSSSPTAGRVGEAVKWIDEQSTGDPFVRLLLIPAYYTTAFWLELADQDQIVVVDRPPRFEGLDYRKIYTYTDFRQRLRDMPRPQGVPSPS